MKTPFFEKQKNIISILALLVSLSSLIVSITTLRQTNENRQQMAAPNVQVDSVEGSAHRQYSVNDKSVIISVESKVVLENRSNLQVQIVDVQVDPIVSGSFNPDEESTQVFAINDRGHEYSIDENKSLYNQSTIAIAGIKNPTFRPKEVKNLNVYFSRTITLKPENKKDIPTIRVVFTFSSGQVITILPEIKYISGGI